MVADMYSSMDVMMGSWPACGGEAVAAIASRAACAVYSQSDPNYPSGRNTTVTFPDSLLSRSVVSRKSAIAGRLMRHVDPPFGCSPQELGVVAKVLAAKLERCATEARDSGRGESSDADLDSPPDGAAERVAAFAEDADRMPLEEDDAYEESASEEVRLEGLHKMGYHGSEWARRELLTVSTRSGVGDFDASLMTELVEEASRRGFQGEDSSEDCLFPEGIKLIDSGVCSLSMWDKKAFANRSAPSRLRTVTNECGRYAGPRVGAPGGGGSRWSRDAPMVWLSRTHSHGSFCPSRSGGSGLPRLVRARDT